MIQRALLEKKAINNLLSWAGVEFADRTLHTFILVI